MFVAAVALQLLLAGCVGAQGARDSIITTMAGGMSGELVANATNVKEPTGVATDRDGNVIIVSASRIWLLNVSTGLMVTVAGNGAAGFSGDGGPATSASLNSPHGVAVDGSGNVLIADTYNSRVRRLAAGTGVITTVAGNGGYGFSGDGGPGTSTSLYQPTGVAVDGGGNVFIADRNNHRIRRLAAGTGIITTVAGDGTYGYSGDNGPGTSASLAYSQGLAVDGGGNVLIADSGNHRIRRLAAGTGIITTVAGNGAMTLSGDGGPGISANLAYSQGLAVDGGGNLFIADTDNRRIRLWRLDAGTQVIKTVADIGFLTGMGPERIGLAIDSEGNLFVAENNNDFIYYRILRVATVSGIVTTVAGGNGGYGFSGDGGPGTSARFGGPLEVAVDPSGNVFIADSRNNRIRRIAAGTGIITTVAGNGTFGYSGDGGPGTSASLGGQHGGFLGIAVDGAGNLFIADALNNRVRRLAAGTAIITTVAGNGVAGFSGDGGPGTSASLSGPHLVTVDGSGNNLYIDDGGNNRIRRLDMGSGIITTVAGNGTHGYSGDDGPGTSATLSPPSGLAVDAGGGNLYLGVWGRIRRLMFVSATGTPAPSSTATYTATNSATYTPTSSDSSSVTGSPSNTRSASGSGSGSTTGTCTRSSTPSPSATGSISGTGSPTGTGSQTGTVSGTASSSQTGSGSSSDTRSSTDTGSITSTGSSTCTPSPSATGSVSETRSVSGTPPPTTTATGSASTTATGSTSGTRTPTASPTPSVTPYCQPSLFRPLPRTDLVGSLVGTALAPGESVRLPSVDDCRQACCDAAVCDGYAFDVDSAKWAGGAGCFLYAGITGTAPSSGFASGLRADVVLPNPPASASPVRTSLPTGGWPQRGASVTATPTSTVPSTPSATAAPVSTSGLVAHYPFDGDYNDASGNGLHLSSLNAQGFSAGVINSAAVFSRSAASVLFSAPTTLLPSGNAARTVSAWFLPTDALESGLVSWGQTQFCRASVLYLAGLGHSTATQARRVTFLGWAGPNCNCDESGAPLAMDDGAWHHAAFTYDGDAVRTFFDGVQMTSCSISSGLNTPMGVPLVVGRNLENWWDSSGDRGQPFFFTGAIDELFVFSRALTGMEISQLARANRRGTPAPSTAPPYCVAALFRSLPRMDLVGTLVGSALTPGAPLIAPSTEACRQACCDAPACHGFAFAVSLQRSSAAGTADCFLYVNITQLIPSSVVVSGIYESTL